MKLQLKTSPQRGTTLTEVVAAVAILAICAAGLMGALANGFFTIQLARENQRATQILIQEAEMIRLYNWDQINTPGFIPTNFTAVYDPQSSGGGGVTYTGSVSIAPVSFAANYATNIRRLTLRLDWATKDVQRTRTLTTLVSRDGLQNYVY
jgi:prepilin-type N-terminal cleavage/methylation domain-containing protein